MGGRAAAVHDMVAQLSRLPSVSQVVMVTNAPELRSGFPGAHVDWDLDRPARAFHFGQRLSEALQAHPADAYAYFGAGCAPLLSEAVLADALDEVVRARAPRAVTNNALSSDWLIFNTADAICRRPERFARDNMLAPVLKYEAGVNVRGLPASAATRADIDTPTDLLALSLHPRLQPALAAFLRAHAEETSAWRDARAVLQTPGGRITLIGRVSSAVWSQLEARTRCWTRVLSEERGMAASGRQSAGKVWSLVGQHLQQIGARAFFEELSAVTDAAFFDTRVTMMHTGRWPSPADRYASDAGRPELIEDAFVRELTEAARQASVPVVLGGHGAVTGDLYAVLETLPLVEK
jgi:hypothetical protein